jgi:arylsulfatase A-like enzyme
MKNFSVNSIRYKLKVTLFLSVTFFMLADSGFAWAQSPNPGSKPNIIFLAIDDLNDWINPEGLGGLPGLKTPNFDRLRKMSMSFTNAHIPSPACAPSRVAIMTGVSPARSGVTGWKHSQWRKVPALKDVATMEQFFKA